MGTYLKNVEQKNKHSFVKKYGRIISESKPNLIHIEKDEVLICIYHDIGCEIMNSDKEAAYYRGNKDLARNREFYALNTQFIKVKN